MTWLTLTAVYFIVWWLCLFVVLPFGVRTQDEEGSTILGTVGSAPARPMLLRKALITSLLAAVVVGLLWVANQQFGLNLMAVGDMFPGGNVR
jgi:predicted secreted protein